MALDVIKAQPKGTKKAKREILPKIVELSSNLPVRRQGAPDVWSQTLPDNYQISDERRGGSPVVKCPKFKNLFQYDKRHNDKFNLKRDLWKIPSMGNNFLPFKKKNDQNSENEIIELYRPKFNRWYDRLVHENTVVLPPVETSTRVRDNVYDSTKLREKNYIMDQQKETGPRGRFVRDEVHLPDVYSQCYTCRECQKQYTSDMYIQSWRSRNNASPSCRSSVVAKGDSGTRTLGKRQHCDVLGERCCRACIERRNKNFSLKIENMFAHTNNANNIHYNSTTF